MKTGAVLSMLSLFGSGCIDLKANGYADFALAGDATSEDATSQNDATSDSYHDGEIERDAAADVDGSDTSVCASDAASCEAGCPGACGCNDEACRADGGLCDLATGTCIADPTPIRIQGTFSGGNVHSSSAASYEVQGQLVWHANIHGASNGITIEGWIR